MFDKEYSFKGSHAEKVNRLTAKFDDKNQLFKRNLDVYIMAPIVGFLSEESGGQHWRRHPDKDISGAAY